MTGAPLSTRSPTARPKLVATAAAPLPFTRPDIDPSVADEDILEAMIAHPILVERPIVVTAKGTALCRPSEKVLDLIDRWPPGPFAKEDGELVIDAEGKRVG